MARLTVTQGDSRRRFKLPTGTLTVGSADSCTLTLDDPALAPLHVTLEVDGDAVQVSVTQGVQAPRLAGAPVEGTIAWEPGASLEIGGVTLGLETDAAPAAPAAPAGKATTPQVTRTARSGGSGARRTASGGGHRASGGGSHSASSGSSHRATGGRRGAAVERTGSGKVQRRTRATPQKGIPTWLMLVFFAVGVLVVIQMLGNYADSSQEEAFDAKTSLARLEEALAEGNVGKAETEMAKVERHDAELTPEWRERFAGIRAQTRKLSSKSLVLADNLAGTRYLDNQLRKYEKNYLAPQPTRPRARVFVKRAKDFLERWPDHPDLEEVRNKLRRWEPTAEPSQPANLQDLIWEAKTLTWAFPRDYEAALALLEGYRSRADETDLKILEGVLQTHRSEREDYFKERYEYAAHYWDTGDTGKAVEYLVQLINKVGEPGMVAKAADSLVAFEGQLGKDGKTILSIVPTMKGYKRDRPADFERLGKNATMRAFFSEHGI